MGHTSERTTQIYLSLLVNSVIDTANRRLTRMCIVAAEPELHTVLKRFFAPPLRNCGRSPGEFPTEFPEKFRTKSYLCDD